MLVSEDFGRSLCWDNIILCGQIKQKPVFWRNAWMSPTLVPFFNYKFVIVDFSTVKSSLEMQIAKVMYIWPSGNDHGRLLSFLFFILYFERPNLLVLKQLGHNTVYSPPALEDDLQCTYVVCANIKKNV